MDPDILLEQMLDLSGRILEADDNDEMVELAEHLAERIEAMNDWITKGGFLPKRWARKDDDR